MEQIARDILLTRARAERHRAKRLIARAEEFERAAHLLNETDDLVETMERRMAAFEAAIKVPILTATEMRTRV